MTGLYGIPFVSKLQNITTVLKRSKYRADRSKNRAEIYRAEIYRAEIYRAEIYRAESTALKAIALKSTALKSTTLRSKFYSDKCSLSFYFAHARYSTPRASGDRIEDEFFRISSK